MDRYSGKGGGRGLLTSRKDCNIAFKDETSERDHKAQFCNRIGCSGRLKYSQNTKVGSSDKGKQSQPCSSNGNEIRRNSSSNPVMTVRKTSSFDSKRKLSPRPKFNTSESSLSSESEAPVSRSPTKYQSASMKRSGKFTMTEVGSSSLSSNVGPRKKVFHNKSGSQNQNTQPASYVPSASTSSTLEPIHNTNGSRYRLRNLKCNSISDVVPTNCSSSESKSVGKNVLKKSSPEQESNLSRGGRKIATSTQDRHVSSTTSGVSISDFRRGSSASGEHSNTAGSVRARRSTYVNTRRLSYLHNGRNSSNDSSQVQDNEMPFNVGGRNSSRRFSPNLFSSSSSSYSLSSSNDDNPSGMSPFTRSELGLTHLMNSETLHRYNMNGIAEVLLALERIGQNEELTHEQLLSLETGLFLSGLNLYDQHRDMRLDIDNMSYEELLALEERMGSVSTALSEEALSNCLKRETYQATSSDLLLTGSGEDGDDIKCSICQEEYAIGDEIGKLVECQHGYHKTCINQWLRLKNWCPICKSSAAPSQSS